jgi:hypothetical protein
VGPWVSSKSIKGVSTLLLRLHAAQPSCEQRDSAAWKTKINFYLILPN